MLARRHKPPASQPEGQGFSFSRAINSRAEGASALPKAGVKRKARND
jgi:hypothetical protein